jgi:hypothetical protein
MKSNKVLKEKGERPTEINWRFEPGESVKMKKSCIYANAMFTQIGLSLTPRRTEGMQIKPFLVCLSTVEQLVNTSAFCKCAVNILHMHWLVLIVLQRSSETVSKDKHRLCRKSFEKSNDS